MSLSLKNLDDESPDVALGWAEALARCICTAVEYNEQSKSDNTTRRNAEDEGAGADAVEAGRKSSRKATGFTVSCSSLNAAISFLVDQFIKVGGEFAASRGGGPFSIGGRAVRAGFAIALLKLVRLQSKIASIGESGMSIKEVISAVLKMVGPSFEKQLSLSTPKSSSTMENLDATSAGLASSEKSASSLFGQTRLSSQADAGLVRLAASRVLRQGLSEISSEPTQLAILNELIRLCKDSPAPLNTHQLQVALIEMSHLFTALGEGTASCLSDAVEVLKFCLVHIDHGVRHEAALACAAFAASFNVESRKLVRSSVDEFQLHHAELFALASTADGRKALDSPSSRLRRFRRSSEPKQEDPSVSHQCAIHGYALVVSVLLKELPRLPGGLPSRLLATALSAAEILISCQYNEALTQANPSAACICVRAGYGIICGALTAGSEAVTPHIATMFGLWQKSCKSAGKGGTFFTPDHDLICLDAMISSVVVFLSYCSELLLAVPDALSRTTQMLEEVLLLFIPGGRLGTTPTNPAAASRHESAKAFIMEAFAWLPPGSFPMAADGVFSLAAAHIQLLTEEEVTCSILSSLVNKEDGILDARSMSRARRVGQVGGARDLEEAIIWLSSDTAHHGERESVLHFRPTESQPNRECLDELRGSTVLGLFALDNDDARPPTPLHEVGTWRKPMEPFCSTKVRLVDASIQAFAATFGMKGGKEQQAAVDMLETLVPPFLAQLARLIGVNSALTETERRIKSKDENPAVANITAVLLACLKSLPLHEASNDVPIGLGPPWMKKAKDLLLTLMPSASNVVRRAATEGLSLLATLCVTEDAHFLQSTVLHSLDEVMQGNNPDGKPKTIPLEPVSAARAGSLLTLACIQRTARNIQTKQSKRARNRISRVAAISKQKVDELPTLQMMTRILPSVACYGLRDAFVVRTYAIHSFGLLLIYSGKTDNESPTDDDVQLIRKGVEIVEDNFLASWTAASTDLDRGLEAEKLEREASFLAVLIRLMTHLVPSLRHLESTDPFIANRFAKMVSLILECFQAHPVVFVESMAFFELMISRQQRLSSPPSDGLKKENGIVCGVPFVLDNISPELPSVFFAPDVPGSYCCLGSPVAIWAVVHVVKQLVDCHLLSSEWCESRLIVALYSLLEVTCARRCFYGCSIFRSLAAPREAESNSVGIEGDVVEVLEAVIYVGRSVPGDFSGRLLQWILLSRALMAGTPAVDDLDESERNQRQPSSAARYHANTEAFSKAVQVFAYANPVRWQVKCEAAKIATIALEELAALGGQNPELLTASPIFNAALAKAMLDQSEEMQLGNSQRSFLVLHLNEVMAAACASAVAALDQSELRLLQETSIHFLTKLIELFGRVDDPEQPDSNILSQYSTQIVSSVKHSLAAPDEDDFGSSKRLFLAGCLALQTMFKSGLSEDTAVLKRLVRLIIPSREETPFFDYNSGLLEDESQRKEDTKLESMGCSRLPIISKLWTLGRVYLTLDSAESVVEVPRNLKVGIAIHSAALAMDGARLLERSGFSLCGIPHDECEGGSDVDSTVDRPCGIGFLYGDMKDIDDYVKVAMSRAWASCGAYALYTLVDILNANDETEERRSSCAIWLQHLVPLMFAGVLDSISVGNGGRDLPRPVGWVPLLDSFEVAADCIRGLSALVKCAGLVEFEGSWNGELEIIASHLSNQVFSLVRSMPSNPKESIDEENESSLKPTNVKPNQRLVMESCCLIENLAALETQGGGERPALMMTILGPFNELQNGTIHLTNPCAEIVIVSSLTSAASLISHPSSSESLVKAMIIVANDILHGAASEKLKDAATHLLGCAVHHNSVTLPMQQRIACDVAGAGNWAAWSALCRTNTDGRGIGKSLSILQQRLSDFDPPEQQMAALTAVRQVVQQLAPSPLVGRILHGVGPELFGILHAYGTAKISQKNHSYRTAACSDGVKVILVAYQQLASDEEMLPSFLTLMFSALIHLIRFNGLPNHPSPQTGADTALGRMSAQSIVYVARTTPAAFKACLANLQEHDRAVLELAVRADMSGYAAPAQAAPKKKLDLKGFKS